MDNVQNGPPDGIAIIDLSTCTVVDALSYEGSITAAVLLNNECSGSTFNLVEGTATSVLDSNMFHGSLIRNPNGADSGDASADWAFSSTPTPGDANVQ
jgi:hypothetical protein